MRRKIILKGEWARWPRPSQAVWPVLNAFSIGRNWAFPTQDTIGCLCNICEPKVAEGIHGLLVANVIQLKRLIWPSGNQGWQYKPVTPTHNPKITGQDFRVFSSVVFGGNWRQLTPTAKALYITLLGLGKWDVNQSNIAADVEDYYSMSIEYGERAFDTVHDNTKTICHYAGIATRSFQSAFDSLDCACLAKEVCTNAGYAINVYIRPPYKFKKSFLEKQIAVGNKRKGQKRRKMRRADNSTTAYSPDLTPNRTQSKQETANNKQETQRLKPEIT